MSNRRSSILNRMAAKLTPHITRGAEIDPSDLAEWCGCSRNYAQSFLAFYADKYPERSWVENKGRRKTYRIRGEIVAKDLTDFLEHKNPTDRVARPENTGVKLPPKTTAETISRRPMQCPLPLNGNNNQALINAIDRLTNMVTANNTLLTMAITKLAPDNL